MRLIRIICVFILLHPLSNIAQSQQDSLSNSLDLLYTPRAGGALQSKKNIVGDNANIVYAIRLMPFDLLRGNIVVENEINVQYAANVVLGIGYNVMSDQLRKQTPFDGVMSWLPKEENVITVNEILKYAKYDGGSIFLSAGLKTHVSELSVLDYQNADGIPFQGLYLVNRLSYYSSKYILPSVINNTPVEEGKGKLTLRNFLINTGIGYSITTNGKVKTVHDFYIAAGAVVNTFPRYFKQIRPNGSAILQYERLENKRQFSFGALMFGYSFGFGF